MKKIPIKPFALLQSTLQTNHTRADLPLARWLCLFIVFFSMWGGINLDLWGQNDHFCGTIVCPTDTSILTCGEPLYYDRFGNLYTESELMRGGGAGGGSCTPGSYFGLQFTNSPSGTWTLAEQSTVCSVFNTLAALIQNPSGMIINIEIIKTDALDAGVLGTGSPFWSNADCGIVSTTLYQALNGSPTVGSLWHGRMEIRQFGTTGDNWHTLDEDGGVPPTINADEFDLFSVAMHEALHILGFAS